MAAEHGWDWLFAVLLWLSSVLGTARVPLVDAKAPAVEPARSAAEAVSFILHALPAARSACWHTITSITDAGRTASQQQAACKQPPALAWLIAVGTCQALLAAMSAGSGTSSLRLLRRHMSICIMLVGCRTGGQAVAA
jgi:hypothetical protein